LVDVDGSPAGEVELVMAYFLERDTEDGPFLRARLMHERFGQSWPEIFEIGEPIHLHTFRVSGHEKDKVWWIKGFIESNGGAKALVTGVRGGCPGELGIPIRELEKVPAMLRLALESQ
jgi:hypothetical protein